MIRAVWRRCARAIALWMALAAAGQAAGTDRHSLDVDGVTRQYHAIVPRGLDPARPAPVIISFHGGGGQAVPFARRIGVMDFARQYGAIVLLPEGLGAPGRDGGSWDPGSAVPVGFAARSGVDDLGFVAAMLTDVAARHSVDPDRVFALGMSQGGMMAYAAACSLPGRFAAIAVVAGTLEMGNCPAADDVSLLHIHGTEDENVPFEGGRGALSAKRARWAPVAPGIAAFQSANSCATPPQTRPAARDTVCRLSACADDQRVELCLVEGGGHAWPGIDPARWQRRYNVYVSPHFNATHHIGQFFFGN